MQGHGSCQVLPSSNICKVGKKFSYCLQVLVLWCILGPITARSVPGAPPLEFTGQGRRLHFPDSLPNYLFGQRRSIVPVHHQDRCLQWLRLRGGSQVQQQQQQQHRPQVQEVIGWEPDMELLQVMHDYLDKTLLPTVQDRAAGEQGLQELQTRQGFVPALFTVVGTAVVRLDVRQAAALYCKNFIRHNWLGASSISGCASSENAVQTINIDDHNRVVEGGAEEEDLSEASSTPTLGGGAKDAGQRLRRTHTHTVGISATDREIVHRMLVPAYLAGLLTLLLHCNTTRPYY